MNSDKRSGTAIILVLLVSALAAGCLGPASSPTSVALPPLPASPPSTPSTAEPAPAITPAAVATSEAAPTPTTVPAATPTPATPSPTLSPVASPTAVPGATPWPGIPAAVQNKISGNLQFLMMVRDRPDIRSISGLREVFEDADRKGGAEVGIEFDHVLTGGEISSLEAEFGIRFHRVNGQVRKWSPIMLAIVPWDRIEALAGVPYVKSVDTTQWPLPSTAQK
ncbi:MAG: hypothetical protein HY673_18680 [Chloroflexi bacterium]|nr:hypothetical protein [Chloroflexota bacterium]